MCLAIYKPKGQTVKKRWLENGFQANPNGAGFAWSDGEKVTIEKGFFDFGAFWKAYKGHQDDACAIHFRLATHGAMNEVNCHPFPLCDGKYAVIHNGILNIQSTNELSDTGHFVQLVMEPAVQRLGLADPVLHYLIEQAIGTSNKIVVLQPDGSAVLFNEKGGMWVNGIWFSNNSYDEPSPWKSWYERERNGKDEKGFPSDATGIGDWERGRDTMRYRSWELFGGSEEDELTAYYESVGFSQDGARNAAKADLKLE